MNIPSSHVLLDIGGTQTVTLWLLSVWVIGYVIWWYTASDIIMCTIMLGCMSHRASLSTQANTLDLLGCVASQDCDKYLPIQESSYELCCWIEKSLCSQRAWFLFGGTRTVTLWLLSVWVIVLHFHRFGEALDQQRGQGRTHEAAQGTVSTITHHSDLPADWWRLIQKAQSC